jgi:hypothetical protein
VGQLDDPRSAVADPSGPWCISSVAPRLVVKDAAPGHYKAGRGKIPAVVDRGQGCGARLSLCHRRPEGLRHARLEAAPVECRWTFTTGCQSMRRSRQSEVSKRTAPASTIRDDRANRLVTEKQLRTGVWGGRAATARVLRTLAVVGIVLATSAHVGTSNAYFEGTAGPYGIRVIVRTPGVIPGLAQISVRVTRGTGVERVSVRPLRADLGLEGAPPPDIARPVPGETDLYSAELWLMTAGSYSVHVNVAGAAGEGAPSCRSWRSPSAASTWGRSWPPGSSAPPSSCSLARSPSSGPRCGKACWSPAWRPTSDGGVWPAS